MPARLSDSQLEAFDRDGFLVVPNFLDEADTTRLLARAKQLLTEMSLEGHPMVLLQPVSPALIGRQTKFETADSAARQHVGDECAAHARRLC